jgi:hypothetical protein
LTRYIIGKHIPGDGARITTWGEVGDGEFGSRIAPPPPELPPPKLLPELPPPGKVGAILNQYVTCRILVQPFTPAINLDSARCVCGKRTTSANFGRNG